MVGLRDFLSGVIAGVLHFLITPQVIGFIPSFGQWILTMLYNVVFLGIWVVVATLILEKTGH